MVHRSVGWRWRLIRTGRATILLGALSGLTGCNLCCPPYMDDYTTIGGNGLEQIPPKRVDRHSATLASPRYLAPAASRSTRRLDRRHEVPIIIAARSKSSSPTQWTAR